MAALDVRVLGPFAVSVGGSVAELGGPRVRTVLALLAADAGRTVSTGALVDGVWGGRPPPEAERTLRTYVSRLRRALRPADGLLETRPPGYLLRTDAIDAIRFARLAAEGRAALDAGRPADAARTLAEALGCWRGEAYAEFAGTPALDAEAARLDRLRLAALADRIDADLATGAGPELVAELTTLTERHPADERLWGQLMRALYRAGRQADALATFRRARAVLVDEAGVEPSPALADLHRRVLAQDPGLASPAAAAPMQLPPAVRDFTGRDAELAALDAAVAAGGGGPAIAVVSGTAGVGKTALALHWAHRADFPDGRLYVNLRGFDPAAAPLDPADAARSLLDALGTPPDRVPAGLAERTALFRSLAAGRRLLLVLDNARDAAQVRPLLPGTAGCAVVVTSRDTLSGLVARDGARRVPLGVPAEDEALALLEALTGRRSAALVRQCARLPLAVRIAAELVLDRGLDELVADLADEQRRLDLLDAGADGDTAVRAVFSWSERHLPPAATRLFWLLGLQPGEDTDAELAAALAGTDVAGARALLETLGRAHLLTRLAAGRWTMHDLLRAYARERAAAELPEDERRAALAGLGAAAVDRTTTAVRAALRDPADPADAAAARAWLDAHRRDLVAIALAAQDVDVATGLARALTPYLTVGYRNADAFAVHGHALAVAERAGDDPARASALLELGTAHARSGDADRAIAHYDRAVTAFRACGDRAGEARAVHQVASTELRLGRYAAALGHFREALEVLRAAGEVGAEAAALASIGQLLLRQGRPDEAVEHFERAAVLYGRTGHRVGQGRVLNDLGTALRRRGRYAEARDRHERALEILTEVGDRAAAACALTDLGRIASLLGRHAEAAERHGRALAEFREIGDRVGEAEVLLDLGDAAGRAGRHDEALERHRAARELAAALGDRRTEALALLGQGRALLAAGRTADGLALCRAARTAAADLGDREVETDAAEAMDGAATERAPADTPV